MDPHKTTLGCECLLDHLPVWFRSARLGLLANQASVTSAFEPVNDLVRRLGGKLSCLFSPQHGYHSEKQANMIESSDAWDHSSAVPIFSLYGSVRKPSDEMMKKIDVLIIDLQDVGTRVYTYGITMGLCLEAAARAGVKVVVLDRPNPITGRYIEGNLLDEAYKSFVGRYPIPMRHGLTMGELARFIVGNRALSCELEILPMENWRRGMFFPETSLPWVFPSPNMPSLDTALLYPGMVLFEGTNVSEGRGTTLPFQLLGAPFLNQKEVARLLAGAKLQGVFFRPVCFEPVFDKWRGELCRGFQIHITDREQVRPYRLAIALLQALCAVHPDEFQWLPPPYEYELEKLPIEILFGDGKTKAGIENGVCLDEMEAEWSGGLNEYRNSIEGCLLYI